MRILSIAILALLAACACREEPAAREAAAPQRIPEAAVVADAKPDAEAEAKLGAGPRDAGAPDAAVARFGRLCVAPLDYSETPGKGASSPLYRGDDLFGDGAAGPSPTRRNVKVIVKVNGEKQEITMRKGARFDGLSLHEPVEVSLADPGQRPYFGKRISFEKEGADALCLYENAFYATVQLSAVPRRPFCRKCMKGDAP